MSEHPYFLLNCPNQIGKLLLTPCPGTLNTNIEEALRSLKNAGAIAVLTLMSEEEMHRHNVSELNTTCEALQLEWFHLPIDDEGAPEEAFEKCWIKLSKSIHHYLNNDKAVVVHCKGGSGRTGVVAARLLIERGLSVGDAMSQIKSLRPNAFSHDVQVRYIENFAQSPKRNVGE